MWNCTHLRHPTDEHLRHVDIFFSNYYNLQSVHFELIRKRFLSSPFFYVNTLTHLFHLNFPHIRNFFEKLKLSIVRSCSLGGRVSFDSNLPPRHEALCDRKTRELPLLCVVRSFVAARLLDQSLKGTIIRKFNGHSTLSVA